MTDYQSTEGDLRPCHIYYMHGELRDTDLEKLKNFESELDRRVLFCTNWGELTDQFNAKPASLCISAKYFKDQQFVEVINMIETLSRLMGVGNNMTITIGIDFETPYSLIKEAQRSKVIGIVPSSDDYGSDETLRALSAQWSNIPYWPKHILDGLLGAKKSNKPTTEIKLTNRQQQIFDMVTKRGSSNKHIAKMLGISESTVKLHMSHIFKKYCVKNRTQLAVFSHNDTNTQ